MTLSILFEKFMAKKKDHLAPSTFKRYEEIVNKYLEPEFGCMKVAELKQRHLVDAYTRWAEKGRSGRPYTMSTNSLEIH